MSRLLLFVFISIPLFSGAKEFAVGFSPEQFKKIDFSSPRVQLLPGAKTTRILKNLDLIVVEAKENSIGLLKNNPAVSFVEELEEFQAPPQRFSLPFETFGQKNLQDLPWGILEVAAPLVWERTKAGEGINVLVLDSGIDQDHPSLSSRLVEARDLMGTRDSSLPYPHFDKIGHGTHVAGTILADGSTNNVIGVAPSASLYVGKVCNSGCNSSAILAGIDWAIEEKMHVVNMSLGGPFGNFTAERVYKRAEEANVVVIAASGNEGRASVSFPANYPNVFSVGAIDESRTVASFSNWGPTLDVVAPGVNVLSSLPIGTGRGTSTSIQQGETAEALDSLAIDGTPLGEITDAPLVYVGLGKAEDYEGKDLSGKIALVSRGEIAFGLKAQGAIQAGAAALIIFNNVPNEPLNATYGQPLELVGVTLTMEQGQKLVDALNAGEEVNASVGILATDFDYLAGTSMATPHVSGVAALVRAANPSLNAVEVKNILKTSAVPTLNDNSENKYGAGIINASNAVEMATTSSDQKQP